MKRVALSAAALFVIVSATASAQTPAPAAGAAPAGAAAAPAGNVQNGQKLFMQYYCYSCHGSDGQGGAGARLMAPNTPNYNAFRGVLRKGSGGMPPYRSAVVPDADVADLFAYVKSIPAPKSARDIPMLNLGQ
jgi:mono/diheme cytochrome c family protein